MAKRTTTPTLKLLRAALLLALVGFLALVFALYRFGKSGMSQPQRAGEAAEEEQQETVMAGEGFDYLITQGETSIARIRAKTIASQTDDQVALEEISPIEVYRDDGEIYRVYADRGTYNLDTQETRLRSDVRLEGPRELKMITERLNMTNRGRWVESTAAVSFSMAGEFRGRARRVVGQIKRDLFRLMDNVEIFSTSPVRDPIRLTCDRLIFDRQEGFIHAMGSVSFEIGKTYFRGPEMRFFLTEDESQIRYVAGDQGVDIRFVREFSGGVTRTAEVSGESFAAIIDPATGDPVEAEIRSKGGRPSRLWTTDESSVVRLLTAPILHATFQNGEISRAEAFDGVHMREFFAFDRNHVVRWGCGDRMEADFTKDGEIKVATFHERVEFRSLQATINADRVDMTNDPYEITMTGDPARMRGVEGELTAPTIVQEGEDGPIHATGGVRGLFTQGGSSPSMSIGGARGPMRLESKEAIWDRSVPSFRFYDNVRLWQEENLLLAQEVETYTERDVILARGGVKTILKPEEKEEKAGEPEEQDADPPPPVEGDEETVDAEEEVDPISQEPVEVNSQWMEYQTETKKINYYEGVLMVQGGRRMTCQAAEATLGEEGGMDTLFCRGNARVQDNVAGRTVAGDTAFYDVSVGDVTFQGQPVVMTGDKGERVEGTTLVYDLASGGAQIRRGDGPAQPLPPIPQDPGSLRSRDSQSRETPSEDDGDDTDSGDDGTSGRRLF